MLKEKAPYTERKNPTTTVEEIKTQDAPESETRSLESWVYAQLKQQNTDARKSELAEADAERHNYQEPE